MHTSLALTCSADDDHHDEHTWWQLMTSLLHVTKGTREHGHRQGSGRHCLTLELLVRVSTCEATTRKRAPTNGPKPLLWAPTYSKHWPPYFGLLCCCNCHQLILHRHPEKALKLAQTTTSPHKPAMAARAMLAMRSRRRAASAAASGPPRLPVLPHRCGATASSSWPAAAAMRTQAAATRRRLALMACGYCTMLMPTAITWSCRQLKQPGAVTCCRYWEEACVHRARD